MCGKLFTPCGDCEKDKSAFHWRSIACSMECAKEYLRRIEESREKNTVHEESPVQKNESVVVAPEIEKVMKKVSRVDCIEDGIY